MSYYYLKALTTVLVIYLVRVLLRIYKNIIAARAIGLPVVVVPVDQHNLLWMLLSPIFRPLLRRFLPTRIWERLSLAIRGWEFHEKLRPFSHKSANGGDPARSYVLVGLHAIEIWTADPKVADEILHRVRHFEVPRALEFALGQYGPNVLTANGEQWARHRRIITSVMDERLFETVFEESQRQTCDLLNETGHASGMSFGSGAMTTGGENLFDQMKTITIHVLLEAVMGVRAPWRGSDKGQGASDFSMSHERSLAIAVTNLAGIGLLPTQMLTSWPCWIPGYRAMHEAGHAKIEVYKRSKDLLDQHRKESNSQQDTSAKSLGHQDVTSKLIRKEKGGGTFLSEDEMISNQFILTAAGFETTATTLAYALVLLARYAEWQDWLLEEVDMLWPDNEEEAEEGQDVMEKGTKYSTVFPRAKRMTAFMMETVRLFSPVPHMHRECIETQDIHTLEGSIRVPAHTRVYVNAIALHLLPVWRDINRHADPAFARENVGLLDEYAFRPSRWINADGTDHGIYRPPKGTFVPWAMGPRVCPGQKMAQVEFVAVISTLLRRHRIEAVPIANESREDLERRLDSRLDDSRWVTVLQMRGIFDAERGKGLNMRLVRRR